jgi:subtilisin family serine protease
MKKLAIVCIALCAGAIALTLSPAKTSGKNDKFLRSERAIPNRYIVVLNDVPGLNPDVEVGNAVSELAREYPGNVDRMFTHALKGYAAEMSEADALRLSDDPRVKYVEQDAEVEAQSTQTGATWGISRIDQRNWIYPLDTSYNYNATGAGVSVYIIDTGVLTTHPDFGGRVIDAFDAFHDGTPISECNGHGTHVAGTAGSSTFGVAKNVTIYSVKVFPCWGASTSSDVISGVDWVTRHGVHPGVANMSLGGTFSLALEDAVRSSINSGITYVVAAGNWGQNACNYSPAHLPEAITVGATDQRDYRDPATNYGPCIDVFAPGTAITSTGNQAEYPTRIMSGTSTASPHVAGAAALYLESHPSASPAEVQNYLVQQATPGAVTEAGTGSPNLFLFSLFDTGGSGTCPGTNFGGTLPGSGSTDFQSSSAGFAGGRGRYSGSLRIPDGVLFNLALEKKQGNQWSRIASSSGSPTEQSITYKGRSGTYRWTITSVSGSGNYSLCAENP